MKFKSLSLSNFIPSTCKFRCSLPSSIFPSAYGLNSLERISRQLSFSYLTVFLLCSEKYLMAFFFLCFLPLNSLPYSLKRVIPQLSLVTPRTLFLYKFAGVQCSEWWTVLLCYRNPCRFGPLVNQGLLGTEPFEMHSNIFFINACWKNVALAWNTEQSCIGPDAAVCAQQLVAASCRAQNNHFSKAQLCQY